MLGLCRYQNTIAQPQKGAYMQINGPKIDVLPVPVNINRIIFFFLSSNTLLTINKITNKISNCGFKLLGTVPILNQIIVQNIISNLQYMMLLKNAR